MYVVSGNNLDPSADVTRLKPGSPLPNTGSTGKQRASCANLCCKIKERSSGANSPHIEKIIASQIPKLGRIVAASGQ